MRVLSIDPALRNTGFAVLEKLPGARDPRALTFGVIVNGRNLRQSGCLVAIREQLADVIATHRPEICAIESIIYVQSYKTAITLGAARGAAVIAAAEAGLQIFEYPPKRVKQAIVGKGSAEKQQVAFMIRSLLGLTETPPADAADAIAIGLAHIHASESNAALKLEANEV